MLNYDLVTGKAAYRILKQRDIGALVALAGAFYEECGKRDAFSEDSCRKTADTLFRNEGKGSIFLIEKGERYIGYSIIVNIWSSGLGGNVLCIDEMYIEPGERRRGIAADFIELLGKIAPRDSVSIQLEVDPRNRASLGLCKKLGFLESKERAMIMPIHDRETPV
jgi:GNAT superfamily N-acetyltransferase